LMEYKKYIFDYYFVDSTPDKLSDLEKEF